MKPAAVALRPLSRDADEMRELQRLFEASPSYTERVTGLPPGEASSRCERYDVLI